MNNNVIEIQGVKVVRFSQEAKDLPSSEAVTEFVILLKAAIKKGDLRGSEIGDKVEIQGAKRREMLIEYTDMYNLWKEKALQTVQERMEKRKPKLTDLQQNPGINIKDLFSKYQTNLSAQRK